METLKNAKPKYISEADVHNEIRRFLVHEIGIKPVPCLFKASIISDLGLDSLDRLSLCSHLERKYNIRLDLALQENLKVKDLSQRVMNEYNAKAAVFNV